MAETLRDEILRLNAQLLDEILRLNAQLLDAIAGGDWETYQRLCDPTLTAFEPEARGHLVEGMSFHRFYFERQQAAASNTTIVAPQVRLCGDTAVVTYVRLVQRREGREARTDAFEETRVWQQQSDGWRHVHFHRSQNR